MKDEIVIHYGSDNLLEKIKQGLTKAGKNPERLEIKDLSTIDQLHTGGHIASLMLAEKAHLSKGAKVLDAGCGIGGASRLLSKNFNCRVTGIDIVKTFIDAAEFLTKSTGMTDKIKFIQMSVLETSFEDNSFDCIWCQHTLMNIKEKKEALSEFHRLLKPGGILVLHEITKGKNNNGTIHLPVPWAAKPSLSFLVSSDAITSMLDKIGFTSQFYIDQTEDAKIWWNKVKSAMEKADRKPRPLGPHIIFGENGKCFGRTMSLNLNEGLIEVISAIYRKI